MSTITGAESLADRLRDLGDIPLDRVRAHPPMGTATFDDLVTANSDRSKALCELVDQTLVEKAMGYEASIVAITIARILSLYVSRQKLGLISGADGFFRLPSSDTRGPDVAFVSRERLRSVSVPDEAYPAIAPDLVVEVLSPGNTPAEMTRKRLEYFNSGVRIVWIVDCRRRSVGVYTSPDAHTVLDESATIDGGDVLPEFTSAVAEFFADLDVDWQE